MIDAYMLGKVSRISPEAPVPIIELQKKEIRLGGAANVALNLKSLGAKVTMASIIGEDEAGNQLIQLLQEQQVDFDLLLTSRTRKTTVKTRVVGNKQQMLRMDDEQLDAISELEEKILIDFIRKTVVKKKIDAIIFEDYNKGVLTERVIQQVIEIANENNIITTVDPKRDNFFCYKGVTMFKPNLKELKEGLNLDFDIHRDFPSFEKAVQKLAEILKNKISMVTLSELGVYISDESQNYHFPAHLRDISDVSGAGDTVISVATLCLTSGCSIDDVASISNIAGGLVCEEAGVVSIQKEKLMDEVLRLSVTTNKFSL